MGIEVLVVQHGEKELLPGDPGLTAEGRVQADRTAAWLVSAHPRVRAVWSSPLARARETATPIAAAFGCEVRTDARLRERMNWDDGAAMTVEAFLAEWHRATADRTYEPSIGDSSSDAAARFLAALAGIETITGEGTVVVVTHGGVTVDTLRSLVGDRAVRRANPDLIEDGVPCCAITALRVRDGVTEVIDHPSVAHLGETTGHAPA